MHTLLMLLFLQRKTTNDSHQIKLIDILASQILTLSDFRLQYNWSCSETLISNSRTQLPFIN